MSEHNDWPEDAHLENGNYQNTCAHCGCVFIGYKRRVQCRACYDVWERKRALDAALAEANKKT